MTQTQELVNWSYEEKCEKAVESLGRNGFTAVYCRTAQQAFDYIVAAAEGAATVGFGGSMSVADMKVADRLGEMGKEILNHSMPGLSLEERVAIMRRQLTCDLFLTSTNALTLDGQLVNIDGNGNRVGPMFFGPKKIIVVVGRNKLVAGDAQAALQRIRTWAAPANAKRLNRKTPCAQTGLCADCNSPDRICNITTILTRKPHYTDLHVLVVNEDMGF